MIDTKQCAANILQLLQADPAKYVNFGMYWFLIKALLKQYYTADNLYLLGDYTDPSVNARVPAFPSVQDMLAAALEEYSQNARLNLGSNQVQDADGDVFTLHDADAGQ